MYGCFDSFVIYGWNQGDSDYILTDLPDGIETFARSVIRNHCTEVVYGVICSLDRITGIIKVDPAKKIIVDNAFAKIKKVEHEPVDFEDLDYDWDCSDSESIIETLKNEMKDEHEYGWTMLGYYECLSGDHHHQQTPISFKTSDESDNEK